MPSLKVFSASALAAASHDRFVLFQHLMRKHWTRRVQFVRFAHLLPVIVCDFFHFRCQFTRSTPFVVQLRSELVADLHGGLLYLCIENLGPQAFSYRRSQSRACSKRAVGLTQNKVFICWRPSLLLQKDCAPCATGKKKNCDHNRMRLN